MTERIHCSYSFTQDEYFTLHSVVERAVALAKAENDHQAVVATEKLLKRIKADAPAPKKAHAHGEGA